MAVRSVHDSGASDSGDGTIGMSRLQRVQLAEAYGTEFYLCFGCSERRKGRRSRGKMEHARCDGYWLQVIRVPELDEDGVDTGRKMRVVGTWDGERPRTNTDSITEAYAYADRDLDDFFEDIESRR